MNGLFIAAVVLGYAAFVSVWVWAIIKSKSKRK